MLSLGSHDGEYWWKSIKYIIHAKIQSSHLVTFCIQLDGFPNFGYASHSPSQNMSHYPLFMSFLYTPSSSGSIYKKYLTFLIHYINDVFGPYFRQDTLITQ